MISYDIQLIEDMQRVRDYCRLGRSIRNTYNIPVAYPLKEIECNAIGQNFLWKELRQLICDELNVYQENPFLTDHSGDPAWVFLKDGTLEIALNISKSLEQETSYQLRKSKRQQAQARKNAELSTLSI